VKLAVSTLLFVFLVGLLCPAQNSRPVPPGMRHAAELEAQNETVDPPGNAVRRGPSSAELKSEADQLAELAASIPQGVQNAGKGLLDKDLLRRLKRIEKLSKHLRSELDH
jgi:hypothetical protein